MKLEAIFQGLNVPTHSASTNFLGWFKTRFQNWGLTEDFCSQMPVETQLVAIGGYELFYISDENEILKTTEMFNGVDFMQSGLLPVGGLLDGALLLLDTKESGYMKIGTISSDKLMEVGELRDVLPSWFNPYPLAYDEWLKFRLENLGFLGHY